jgi:hypothetical protein
MHLTLLPEMPQAVTSAGPCPLLHQQPLLLVRIHWHMTLLPAAAAAAGDLLLLLLLSLSVRVLPMPSQTPLLLLELLPLQGLLLLVKYSGLTVMVKHLCHH